MVSFEGQPYCGGSSDIYTLEVEIAGLIQYYRTLHTEKTFQVLYIPSQL